MIIAAMMLTSGCCNTLWDNLIVKPTEIPTETPTEIPTETPTYAPLRVSPAPLSLYVNPPAPQVTDFNVRQAAALAEPAPRSAYVDPAYGMRVARVTDRKGDQAGGDMSKGLKNEYSRVQAFNADGSRLIIRGTDASWYLYDASTLLPIKRLSIEGPVDPRWDTMDLNVFYYFDDRCLMRYDVSSDEKSVQHDFAPDFKGEDLGAVWTRYEGSQSMDNRYWGLMAEDTQSNTFALIIFDQQADRIIARRDMPRDADPDTVTISPKGDYLFACFDPAPEHQMGSDASPAGVMIYDSDLKNGRCILRVGGHCDLALDANGNEVLVYQDIDTDHISMIDLATGSITDLFPIDFSHTGIGLHFSGRALDKPGWALVSTHDGDPKSYTWMDDQVFAVELKPYGRVARLAHTYSLVDENQEHDYWAEPQATVNQDFTKVLFTSNWGRSGTEEVDTYMVVLPPDWMESLPV
jgi:hypothetical protein